MAMTNFGNNHPLAGSYGYFSVGRTVTNRFETFRCQACGRSVKRKSRQQRFCSDRCRNYAHRNDPSQINGCRAIKNASGYPDSGRVTNPLFLCNKNNGLQARKPGSSKFDSAPLDLLGGRWRWPGTARLDPAKRRAIIEAEIGSVPS